MQIPVIVEQVANKGFCARTGEPLSLSAEGLTQDEAVGKLRQLLDGQFQSGKTLVAVEVTAVTSPATHPWMRFAGMFKDDPLFDDWQKAIEDYRRKVDADPDYP
jgi:hypothetical protein